jgi:hypothetical protein
MLRLYVRLMLLACAAVSLLPLAGGCTQSGSGEDETTTDLRQIGRAYGVILGGKNRPPKDIEEIRQVLSELHTDGLNPPAEEVLTSPRDKEQYVVIMGANLGAGKSGDILAYEKKGADGKRYALDMSYEIRQLTDDEFANASFAQGHKPAGG